MDGPPGPLPTPEPLWPRVRRTLDSLRPAGPPPPPGRSARVLVAGLAVLSTISVVGTAASPVLLEHPLVLIALAPRLPFLALAAADAGMLPFLALGLVRLCVGDPLHFLLGRRYGPALVERILGRRRWLARLAGGSGLLAVAVRPIGRHLVLAGAAGTPARAVVVADVAGTLVYLALVYSATRAVAG